MRLKILVLNATMIIFLALLSFTPLTMLQPASASASTNTWPNWRNDIKNTASTNVGPTGNITLWTTTINGSTFVPVVNWGKVFIVYGGLYVAAFNETTGAKIWEVNEGGTVYTPATGTDAVNGTNLVVTQNFDTHVRAYRAEDGAEIWDIMPLGMGWGLGEPVISNGVAYVEDFKLYSRGHVYAINLTNGAVISTYTFPNVGGRPIWGGTLSPCINPENGIVYATGYGKSGSPGDKYLTVLAAIDMSTPTATEVWLRLLNSSDITTFCSPVYGAATGYVYAGENSGNVTCWNAATGDLVWSGSYGQGATSDGTPRGISPIALDSNKNMLTFTSGNHTLWNVNALTGAVNWAVPCNNTLTGGPIIASNSDTVYAATAGDFSAESDEMIQCYNETTGTLIWSYKTGAKNVAENLCSPALADEHLFFVSSNYTATSYNLICFGLHDIAITGVTPSNSFVYQNETYDPNAINISVEAGNLGGYGESFTVTCYANLTTYFNGTEVEVQNMTVVGAQAVTLAAGTSTTLTFPLNGASYALGYYKVSANASIVPGETHTDDNTYTDGTVVVTLFLFHDVTVSNVIPSQDIIGQGYSLTVNVTTANLGTYPENFTVTCYVNSTVVRAQNVTLAAGNIATLTFDWNTAGYVLGYYKVSANASIVLNETHIEDNTYVDGVVKVTTRDVAITGITSYSYVLPETDNATYSYPYHRIAINVTVKNEGLENETFNIYAISSSTWNNTVNNVTLAPGIDNVIQSIWDTRNTAPGTYTVTCHAGATPDQGVTPEENSTIDNSKTISITIKPTYTLTVLVVNITGPIIFGANVTVSSSWSLSNLTGYAVLKYLPSADYYNVTAYTGTEQTSQIVSLDQDKSITLTLGSPKTEPKTELPWLLIMAVIVVVAVCVGVALQIMKKPKPTAPATPET